MLQPLTVADLSNDGLPVHDGAGDRGRLCAVPRAARHVRWRARLGALLPGRVRPASLGHALGRPAAPHGLVAAGTRRSTRSGSRRATGCGARISPPRTRPSRRGSASLWHDEGRSFIGRTLSPAHASPNGGCAALCSRIRAPLRSDRSRCVSADSTRRPRHERRLRLHGGRVDRVRVPAGGARRGHERRGRDLRRLGRRRSGSRAALRPGRGADPGVSRDDPDRLAEAVLRVWPDGASRWEVLGGGITNHNVKVTRPDGVYVLRIAGQDTDLLGIDRGCRARGHSGCGRGGRGAGGGGLHRAGGLARDRLHRGLHPVGGRGCASPRRSLG